MATYFARKAGNINATDLWATTPSGTAGAVTFASGDVLMANSFAITVNVTTNLGSAGQVRNDTTGGATTGGGFTLSDGVTLTANVFAGTAACVGVAASATASLVGNLTGGGANGRALVLSNASSAYITATNLTTGTSVDSSAIYVGSISANLNLTLSGIVTGGSTINNPVIRIDGTGIYSITGNSIGGSVIGAHAIQLNNAAATLSITGNVTGGSNATAYGFNNSLAANPVITGQCIGGVAAPGAFNTTTGSITATRAVGNGFGPGSVGLTAAPGIANSALGVVTIEQLEYGLLGQSPTSGTGIRLKKAGSNVAVFNYCDTAGAKTLIDATQNAAMPAATDVRDGVSYASGALTGSAFIPSPSSVASGVPVDATTGTAILTGAAVATAVWSAASRTITEGGITAADVWNAANRTITGGTVTTLTNAPTVPTAAAIATQVRTELTTELNRLDTNVASRAATGTLASDVTAIKAKTDLLETTRLAQCSTVATTGAQLAAALS
jgi:hypothetical protein